MATITPSTVGTLHQKLSITLTKEDYLPSFEKQLKKTAKEISMPGFRKGMVPVGMVKKMHGQSIFTDEILKEVSSKVDKYMEENKVKYLARPLAVENQSNDFRFDMANPTDFTFDFEYGEKPTFEIPALQSNKSLEKLKVEVSNEMIEEEIEKIRYRAGKMDDDIESIGDGDDVLNVTFSQQGIEGSKQTNSLLVKYFTPDTAAILQGKKVGDTVSGPIGSMFTAEVYPAIAKDLNLQPTDEASKAVEYIVTIDKIGHVNKAELNNDLFVSSYPNRDDINDEPSFRNAIQEEIQGYWNNQSQNRLDNDIFETLIHETPMDLPVDFLKRYLREGDEQKPRTAEEVEKEWPNFDHSIRWELISSKIMEEQKLQVTSEELKHGIRIGIVQQFSQMGIPLTLDPTEDPEWMHPLIEKQMKDNKVVNETYQNILMSKMFEYLNTKIAVVEREVPIAEFLSNANRPHKH